MRNYYEKIRQPKISRFPFNTFCKVTDLLFDEKYDFDSNIHSMKEYDNVKLSCMLKAQENENNILVRRNKNTKNEIGKLLYF